MKIKFSNTKLGFDQEGFVVAWVNDDTLIVNVNDALHQIKTSDIISTDEKTSLDNIDYFYLGESRMPVEVYLGPDKKKYDKINGEMVKSEIAHFLEQANNEGILIGLAICKKMWGEGTLSLNEIIETEKYYQDLLNAGK